MLDTSCEHFISRLKYMTNGVYKTLQIITIVL